MSDTSVSRRAAPGPAARAMLARAGDAESRTRAAVRAAIDDAMTAPDDRLDDRARAAIGTLLAGITASVERDLIDYAARLLTTRGEAALAGTLATGHPPVVERLAGAGLLRDEDFAGECLARIRIEQMAAAMPVDAGEHADAPSLLVRLAQSSDRLVSSAGRAVLAAESDRRALADGGTGNTGLPATLHARLVWWVAAAIRERLSASAGTALPALDRALAEAGLRALASHDESERLEAAAMRLAEAIDAQPAELPALIDEAMRDRRLVVVAALLAHALGVPFALVRDLLIDPAGDRLWLALRALDLPRDLIARVGYLLCEADRRRDVEAFADLLDVIAALDPETAQAALAPLRLHPDYRAAMLALEAPGRAR